MRRAPSLSSLAVALLAVNAEAKISVVGPDPCPAPAEAVIYYAPLNVEAMDENPARRIADRIFVFYDVPLDGWASRRLFARFVLDPRLNLDGRLEGGCGSGAD